MRLFALLIPLIFMLVPLVWSEVDTNVKNPFIQTIEYPSVTVNSGARISVTVDLPQDHEFTEGSPLHYHATFSDGSTPLGSGLIEKPETELPIQFDLGAGARDPSLLRIDLNVSYCTTVQPKLCKIKALKILQPISIGAGGRLELELRAKIQ